MKLLSTKWFASQEMMKIEDLWEDTARQVGMETGVFVSVGKEYGPASNDLGISRLYFIVGSHEFDSLIDLKRAIANKAFL